MKNFYSNLRQMAIDKLLPFPTTYLNESAFSTHGIVRTKQRNRPDAKDAKILAISKIELRVKELSKTVMKNKHTFY